MTLSASLCFLLYTEGCPPLTRPAQESWEECPHAVNRFPASISPAESRSVRLWPGSRWRNAWRPFKPSLGGVSVWLNKTVVGVEERLCCFKLSSSNGHYQHLLANVWVLYCSSVVFAYRMYVFCEASTLYDTVQCRLHKLGHRLHFTQCNNTLESCICRCFHEHYKSLAHRNTNPLPRYENWKEYKVSSGVSQSGL